MLLEIKTYDGCNAGLESPDVPKFSLGGVQNIPELKSLVDDNGSDAAREVAIVWRDMERDISLGSRVTSLGITFHIFVQCVSEPVYYGVVEVSLNS